MVTQEDIQATCDDIVREFSPLQVILFSSHAYGTPTEDSDVDLLVVMDIPESETRHQAVKIRECIPSVSVWICLCVHRMRSLLESHTTIGFFVRSLKEVKCSMEVLALSRNPA